MFGAAVRLLTTWRKARHRLAEAIGTDLEVVRKIECMDQHMRKHGHDLRNLQMKLEPLRRLVDEEW